MAQKSPEKPLLSHVCRETPEHSESLSHHASPRESPSDRGGSVESSIESLSDFDRVILLEQTDSLRELHTILRDQNTPNSDFIFSADRLIRLVVEEGLNHLPYYPRSIITPDNAKFDGIKFARGNCAIALSRSGEAMEFAVRQCCRSIRIGKILINEDNKIIYSRLTPDIRQRRVLLLYPLLHTGTAYIQAIRELISNKKVKEENIYLLSMFSTFYGIRRVHKEFPMVTVITSEINDDVPYYFTMRYFGTD
jgi:uracil phosphoribosyltransferase|uniref:Uracil phosphoribosyltransferase n=1 Tax=Panagrolaimus sp. PS1159 TaxID=55785 RepID=A0AC35G388_9BILA